jgi:hypothetical protein
VAVLAPLAPRRRGLARLPRLLAAADSSGFPDRLSLLQMDVSRTQVFARPRCGREFFEEVKPSGTVQSSIIADNANFQINEGPAIVGHPSAPGVRDPDPSSVRIVAGHDGFWAR